MDIISIIGKKRDGLSLSREEIFYWIEGLSQGHVADYQSSALLMAIVIQGMNLQETTFLTQAMVASGQTMDLSKITGFKVDKHSTGGVGDKTTLVLAPLVASCGAKVAKMSGRGLGHTGGTLDKLEAIPGFSIELDHEAFIRQVNDINIALIGQSSDMVYADKELYALRDVTATVNSLPLIASSIMSKKIASGADCILLDVKYGSGAFMKDVHHAKQLAQTMIAIGTELGRKVNALISNMDQPLGLAIGNALEVKEAVLTLRNQGPKDLEELCLIAAGHMLTQAQISASFEQGYRMAHQALRSKKAYQKFLQWIVAQQGDVSVFDDLDYFAHADYSIPIRSPQAGWIHGLNALDIGLVSMKLGAGRQQKSDVIDPQAGIVLAKHIGDSIAQEEVLATLYSTAPISEELIAKTLSCFTISDAAIAVPQLIADVL